MLRPGGALQPLLWPCGGFCVGVPFPCGVARSFGGFEAWQTAALNAYKKPLLRPGGALEPLLWPGGALQPLLWPCGGFLRAGVARVGLVGVLCGAGRSFGGFEAWQTAALNAYKKPLLRPWGALEPLLWPCGGFLPAGVAACWAYWGTFSCGVGQTFGGIGKFGGFEPWQTAALNAYKRSHCCGRGVLLSHCCGLVVFACSVGRGKSHCCRLVVAFASGRGACGGALQPLLWPCGGFCVREWRALGLLGYLFPAELGAPLEGLERLRPGKRQP